MFLNRYTPWLNVLSFLPYEGKVVLRNKKAKQVLVRIPGWLDMDEVNIFLNDKPVDVPHAERYLIFNRINKNTQIRLEFPVHESFDKYLIQSTK